MANPVFSKSRRAAILALGLTTAGFAGYSVHATSTPSHDWTVKQAEAHALVVLHKLAPSCEASGQAAEAWAEANSEMPHGFEVMYECAGTVNG